MGFDGKVDTVQYARVYMDTSTHMLLLSMHHAGYFLAGRTNTDGGSGLIVIT